MDGYDFAAGCRPLDWARAGEGLRYETGRVREHALHNYRGMIAPVPRATIHQVRSWLMPGVELARVWDGLVPVDARYDVA